MRVYVTVWCDYKLNFKDHSYFYFMLLSKGLFNEQCQSLVHTFSVCPCASYFLWLTYRHLESPGNFDMGRRSRLWDAPSIGRWPGLEKKAEHGPDSEPWCPPAELLHGLCSSSCFEFLQWCAMSCGMKSILPSPLTGSLWSDISSQQQTKQPNLYFLMLQCMTPWPIDPLSISVWWLKLV